MRRLATLALAAALAAGATGCDRLDCFDGGPLEQSYRDGEAAARAENHAAFARGRADGLQATRAD
ncbi:MAG: hypothetical protein K8M05_00275, partial [Deltaproteobacteria bacterium]|nr:hypothetical protein [Kofleriaceae bacterium]